MKSLRERQADRAKRDDIRVSEENQETPTTADLQASALAEVKRKDTAEGVTSAKPAAEIDANGNVKIDITGKPRQRKLSPDEQAARDAAEKAKTEEAELFPPGAPMGTTTAKAATAAAVNAPFGTPPVGTAAAPAPSVTPPAKPLK